ncbi:MAG: SDR family oxidoreductase [Rectinema sp.]|nr:SDR family oxidoreductase [Rectinema sp.]
MTIRPEPRVLAPMVRGLLLSRLSWSCVVQQLSDSAAPESFEDALPQPLLLYLPGITTDCATEDITLAQSLNDAFQQRLGDADSFISTALSEWTESTQRKALIVHLHDAHGALLCRLRVVPLKPLDPRRTETQVREPGNPALLSADLRNAVVEGRIALVTGAAQGFGAEIARGLSHSGAVVWIADINETAARTYANALETETGNSVFAIAIDVRNDASVAHAFETITRTTGSLDLIVSNAGVLRAGSVFEQPPEEFRFVNDVNYYGFYHIVRHAARLLRLQWLCAPHWYTDIIQINSKSGLQGSNRNGAYAGSKFGSIGLVQSFALELIEYHIKVNAICPGNFFDGPLWSDPEQGLFTQYLKSGKVPGAQTIEDVRAFYEAKIPMRRGCYGPDVLKALYYLIDQVYETGQALPVTGGQVMLN